MFPSEPPYGDFRSARSSGTHLDSDKDYRAALLDVAAPLLGRPKEAVDSEDIRVHCKALRNYLAYFPQTIR